MSTTTLRAYLDDVAGLLEQQALEEVIGHCRHILQHFPKNLETYRILGQALLEKNRHQEASDVFQRVLGALPDDFKAHIGMSACWEELQQLPRAIWHMERAFEVDPNNRALQDELKRLMERNRQAPPARFTLSRAALARIYFNGKLYEQAISELQAARLQFSDRYDLEVLYAQSLWNAEHATQATEQALLVLETLPDSLYANRIMAELWLRTSRPSDAKPYFIKVEQLDPFVAWDMLHEDGVAVPTDAFKLPRLQWDVRAAAALATGTPDWMANIGEVFVDPDAVDLSIPSDKRKRVWLDDFGAPAAAPPAGKPRTGGLIDKYTGTPEAPPAPVVQDDAPSWFKEFEKEDKQKKRSTGLSPVIPVWGDDAPDKASTPALSVNAPEKSSSVTADADWLFDGSDEVPPLPPADPAESLEVRAADALSWLQSDDIAAGTDNTLPEADWLFGDDDSADTAPAANLSADMPDTLDWLTEAPPSTPKLSKLPTGDLPTVENSEDALAWLQTGSLSSDNLPPEPVESNEIPAADSAVINDPSEALAWLQTGNLSPDAAPVTEADSAPNLDWLLDESSVPPVDQQPMAASDSFEMFLDEPTQVVASDPATPPVKSESEPVAPPMAWGTDDANDSESNAFAAWLDANPEPTPAPKPNEGDDQWISELQISNALDAAALADQPVATDAPVVADVAPTAAVPTASDNDIDEFALMFDNLDTDLTDLANPSSPSTPSTPAAEAEEHPMAWMMDLGLSVPAADATPAENVMEDFEPFGLTEQDPLAWMREAGLEPPPELALDAEANAGESVAPTDDEAFMASLGTNFSEESVETGLDIQSDLFAPTQNTLVPTNKQPEAVIPVEPEPAPAPLLDLSDPDWLNDFQPIEVSDDDLNLPKTGSLAPAAASDGLDWLAAFGTVETPDASASLANAPTDATDSQASIDIGWLNQSAADQVTAMGSQAFSMPESKADLDVKPEASMPVAVPEPPKVEPAADDWLAGFGVIETEEPSAVSVPADIALPSLDDAFSLDSLLGSIQDAQPDMATAPTTAEDLPQSDWLSSFGFDLDTGDTGRQDQPAATLDVVPIEPIDEEPNWLAGVAPLDLPASADVASNVEDFSSFLDAFKDEVPAVPSASAEISPSTEALVGDNADWLSAFGTDATPAAEVTATPAPLSATTTDDLDSLLDSFTMPAAEASPRVDVNASMDALLGDNADWLSALGSEETPVAKVETSAPQASLPVTDDLDSLLDSFIGESSTASQAESSPASSLDLGGDSLDWLGGLAPVDDILAEQPTAITSSPVADNLDFGGFLDDLADLGAGNDLPAALVAQQQPSMSDDISDWLSDSGVSAPAALAGLDALDFSNLPTAEPDAAAPDLSALMAELGVQPDAIPPVMQSDADAADLAPAAMPDWMASIVPPIEQSGPPSDSDLKRTTTPMDAFNMQSIEPPSEGPSSTGFTDLLRELKVGARPILPPTGALPPIEESAPPAVEAQPEAESDWLAAFVEPEIGSELEATTFDTIGTTSDDEFKLELDAILAPGDMTDEAESGDELNSSTASFDIDSVTDLDLGLGTAEPPAAEVTNEDWLSSLGFTDELATVNEVPITELPAESTQTFPPPDAKAEPAVEQLVDDAWFGAMLTSDDEAQPSDQQPAATEPTMSSSMFARLNPVKPEPDPMSTSVDADAPDWLRDLDSTPSPAPEADQIYNAQSVAPAPDSGNTSKREEKPSSGFALPKRAPRWSRSGKTGDLDPDVLNQPRSTQSVPVVPPDVKPEVPPEKKSANAPDDDFSNLLNSLLDDTDSDLSDLLK